MEEKSDWIKSELKVIREANPELTQFAEEQLRFALEGQMSEATMTPSQLVAKARLLIDSMTSAAPTEGPSK